MRPRCPAGPDAPVPLDDERATLTALSLLAGVLAVAGLLLLPGMWVTFGVPRMELPFRLRVWIGAALSPLVVLVQFYALRLAGVPFGPACWMLTVGNLAVLFLLARHRDPPSGGARPDARWLIAAVAAVAGLYLALNYPLRAFRGHAWMHADIVYQLAGGRLRPEEPLLAGLRLAYPWFGEVQQAAVSYVMGVTPVSAYVWWNAVYLLVTLALTAAIVRRIGGDRHALVWALMLTLFGVNFIGLPLKMLLTGSINRSIAFWVLGDGRYSPWILRFIFFEQEQTALPALNALLWLAVDRPREALGGSRLLLVAGLVATVGVIYTILLPAACLVLVAMAVVRLAMAGRPWSRETVAGVAALGAAAVAGSAVTYLAVWWVRLDVAGPPGVEWSSLILLKLKAASIPIVMFPLLVGAAWALARGLAARTDQALVLALSSAGCVALLVGFHISQGGANEYKFMFPAAMALAPLAALAAGPVMRRLGRRAAPVTAAALLVLAAPGLVQWWRGHGGPWPPRMPIEMGTFDLRLRPDVRYAGAADALRLTTAPPTVLVTRGVGIHLPTVTRRVLYAPYADMQLPGANLAGDEFLLAVNGYPRAVLMERRLVLHHLFEPPGADARAAAFARLAALGRPLGFVVDDAQSPGLSDFLRVRAGIVRLYEGRGLTVWYLPAPPAS